MLLRDHSVLENISLLTDMVAKLWDGSEVKFDGSEVKEISIEVGDYSILIAWNNGNVYRAESIHI